MLAAMLACPVQIEGNQNAIMQKAHTTEVRRRVQCYRSKGSKTLFVFQWQWRLTKYWQGLQVREPKSNKNV